MDTIKCVSHYSASEPHTDILSRNAANSVSESVQGTGATAKKEGNERTGSSSSRLNAGI